MARRIQIHDICRSREKGAVLIEFAVVLVVFTMLIVGGFDMQRIANAKSNVDWIAQTMATCAKTNTCGGNTPKSLASNFGMNPSKITPGAASNPITVHYDYVPISPWFSNPVKMQATATVP